MHALTCKLLNSGTEAYALLPTYYKPSEFIPCKVYIEWVYNSETCIFYHCTLTKLLCDDAYAMQVLHSCQLRCIERRTGKLLLQAPKLTQFAMTCEELQRDLQTWHAEYLLDIPAPFVVDTEHDFERLKQDVKNYFKTMMTTVDKL